ncbi:MAG: ATP-binding cassette domain-containing protein, partial [Lachnospiraceae bacterium]|nr:ATP-binding cassette domain-containing protein [Lachnospiraceae bacterium]
MGNIIQTKNVVQSFPVPGGEFVALKDINIEVPEKKLTILRGRSGSGKATLMNILGGLDFAKSGEGMFENEIIAGLSE